MHPDVRAWLLSRMDSAHLEAAAKAEITWGPGLTNAAGLLYSWHRHIEKFYSDLERDYQDPKIWIEHDYVAALVIRDVLAKAVVLVQPEYRPGIKDVIDEVDQRFRDFTEYESTGIAQRVYGEVVDDPGWWWLTIPKRGIIRDLMSKPWYGLDSSGGR